MEWYCERSDMKQYNEIGKIVLKARLPQNRKKQNKTSSEQTKAKISKCTQINDFLGHFYVFRRKKKDNLVKLK